MKINCRPSHRAALRGAAITRSNPSRSPGEPIKMIIQRRTFLRDAFTSTLSVGLLIAASRASLGQKSAGIPLQAQKEPVSAFVAATFEPYVCSYFTAPNSPGEAIELKMVELTKFDPNNRLT